MHRAWEFNRAHSVAALDRKLPEPVIMQVSRVERAAIWRTSAAHMQGGVELVLHDETRPGKRKQYEVDAEAQSATPVDCATDRGAPTQCEDDDDTSGPKTTSSNHGSV